MFYNVYHQGRVTDEKYRDGTELNIINEKILPLESFRASHGLHRQKIVMFFLIRENIEALWDCFYLMPTGIFYRGIWGFSRMDNIFLRHDPILIFKPYKDTSTRNYDILDLKFLRSLMRQCFNPMVLKSQFSETQTNTWTVYPPNSCVARLLTTIVLAMQDLSPQRRHYDVITWKLFPCYWPFVWRIHRWPVDSLTKVQ